MRRRVIKVALYSLLSVVMIVAAAAGALFWRISQGPVSLAFMNERIEGEMNKALGGLKVGLQDVVLERDAKTGIPSLRLRDLELRDQDGNIIARAPRAAIGLDEHAVFSAKIVPRSLELIGPRILVKRNLEGGLELGFGLTASEDESPIVVDEGGTEDGGKSDQIGAPDLSAGATQGAALLNVLAGDGSGMIGGIETIRVSQASLSLYDESNDAVWNAPDAELAFKRMPYGFAIVANSSIASGGEPWKAEVAASYRRETRTFQVNARISDLVPSAIADDIFALSQLAQVHIPLSGEADFVFNDKGVVVQAKGEFTAAAGRMGFPEYIAEPIIIDEGAVAVTYEPATGGLVIDKATVMVGGSEAEITGRIEPARGATGKLSALRLLINARNVSLDTEGTLKNPLAVDRIDFDGIASAEEARLDVQDLIITSGTAGLRVRGTFLGGEESTAIKASGRIQDMPAHVLKKLWPPIVAPKTRKWVTDNIKSGKIDDAEFIVDFPANGLAKAMRDKAIPDKAVYVKFTASGVTTSYFKDLPLIAGAKGTGIVRGDQFDLTWSGGKVELPSGKEISIVKGSMLTTNILAPVTPSKFLISAAGSAQAVLEYAGLPSLNLVAKSGLDVSKLGGTAAVDIALAMPLQKDLPRDKVSFSAKARIEDMSLKGALQGFELTGGDIALEIDKTSIAGAGPVKINGIPAKIDWSRSSGKDAANSATIELTLDEDERKKIGADVNAYVRGPVKVKVKLPEFRADVQKVSVEADLSAAELRLDAMNFVRPPTKSRATFVYERAKGGGGTVKDLEISGGGFALKGDIVVGAKGGLAEADLPLVVLGGDNRFSVRLKRADGGMSVGIKGRTFDARPMIKTVFANKTSGGGGGEGLTYFIEADIDKVYAHRGEIVTNANAKLVLKGSAVRQIEVTGTFLSGHPMTLRLNGTADGSRQLQVFGRDAGSALRAANLYSKVAGGQLEFTAVLAGGPQGGMREGELVIRNFEVRNEAALAELDRKGKPKKSGPRRDGLAFKRLRLPFTADTRFIRIKDASVKGVDLCAFADGVIRKSDTAIDITGTVVPACGANRLLEDIPVVGLLFPEGILGIEFALGGSMKNPKFQANPISALAPGILRKFFSYSSPKPRKKLTENKD